jgi:peroxiredoxin
MRLSAGEPAPDFTTTDIFGSTVSLSAFAGKRLMLSFYRYAACPLCNIRIHRLIQKYPDFRSAGLHLVAVFQSPEESIGRYVGRQDIPFPVVADPGHVLYTRYGVGGSVFGFLTGGLRLPSLASAAMNGYYPGKMEGDITMVPADFLIGPSLRIETAYYGTDIGDHLPCATITNWLEQRLDS